MELFMTIRLLLLLMLLTISTTSQAISCDALLIKWANIVNKHNKAAGKPILKQIYKQCINNVPIKVAKR